MFEENPDRKWRHHFRKAPFSKCFPPTLKRKADVFRFLRFEQRIRRASFSPRINVDGRHSRRNKAAFSNFSSLVWTLPEAPSWRYAGVWNAALFLRLGLLSVVTRHENGGFWFLLFYSDWVKPQRPKAPITMMRGNTSGKPEWYSLCKSLIIIECVRCHAIKNEIKNHSMD